MADTPLKPCFDMDASRYRQIRGGEVALAQAIYCGQIGSGLKEGESITVGNVVSAEAHRAYLKLLAKGKRPDETGDLPVAMDAKKIHAFIQKVNADGNEAIDFNEIQNGIIMEQKLAANHPSLPLLIALRAQQIRASEAMHAYALKPEIEDTSDQTEVVDQPWHKAALGGLVLAMLGGASWLLVGSWALWGLRALRTRSVPPLPWIWRDFRKIGLHVGKRTLAASGFLVGGYLFALGADWGYKKISGNSEGFLKPFVKWSLDPIINRFLGG